MKMSLGATPVREPAPQPTERRTAPRRFTRDRRRTRHELAELRALTPDGSERQSSRDAMRRDLVFRRGLGLADVVGAAVALLACQALFGELAARNWIFLGVPVVVFVSKAIGLYDRDELVIAKTTLNEAPALFQLATLYTLLITMLAGTGSGPGLPPEAIGALWVLLLDGPGDEPLARPPRRPQADAAGALRAARESLDRRAPAHEVPPPRRSARRPGRVPSVRPVRPQPPALEGVRGLHRRARHPPGDHRRQRFTRRDLRRGPLLQGLRPEGQRAAEPARGRRQRRRVRRRARDDAARRASLRAVAFVGAAEARARPDRVDRPARPHHAGRSRRSRWRSSSTRAARCCSARYASGATGTASRCSSSARCTPVRTASRPSSPR